ncbi:MAG: site-specific integrase [Hyphomicrobium sp.]
MLKADPTTGLAPPIAKEKPRDRELSPDEIAHLWAALERAPTQRRLAPKGHARGEKLAGDGDVKMTRATALAMKLSLVTAQRIGEVAGIAIAELDLNDLNPVWTVPAERSKNGRPNRVPLSPLALQLIREARALAPNSPWLFPGASGLAPMDPHAATKALGRAREAIGLPDFRVHDLRRTAATRMAEIGINPHTISLVLNHVSARAGTVTSKVYVQYSYDREKREALGAWGARLQSIIDGNARSNVIALSNATLA